MFGIALAIANVFQPSPPPQPVAPMLDRDALNKVVEKHKYLFSGPEHLIRKFNFGNNRIDPSLIADGAEFEIDFPFTEKEFPLPNDSACQYYFEYPQISGLADEVMQSQINQMLKDELIGNESTPRFFAYQEECTHGDGYEEPDGQRTVTWLAFSVNMRCFLEFASGSLVSVYCRHSVMPGAYPLMTYYPITFDLRTGQKLSLQEIFSPGSDFAEAIAQGRLQFWFEALESGSWTPPEGYFQERLELLTERYENDFYDFYLQSDCTVLTSNQEAVGTIESCLAFPRIRSNHIAEGIQYNQSIDLEGLAAFLKPKGRLAEAIDFD